MVHTRLMSHVVTGSENLAGTFVEADGVQSKCIRLINDKLGLQEGTVAIYDSSKRAINLLQLPREVLEKVLSYVPYRSVCHLRAVSRKFDEICSGHLNVSFHRLQSSMLTRFQGLKAQMPRRESSRRNHPLACESEIIETLHMRLTLLQMTFGKHIERKHICFFAGDILDEVYRILQYVSATPNLARPYKVTDELFDLSTMAMEYFKERIEPTLPEISCFTSDFLDFANPFNTSANGLDDPPILESYKDDLTPPPQRSTMVLRKRIRRIKQGMKKYNNQLSILRRDIRTCKGKGVEQQKQLLDISSRLDDHDKKNEETSRKFSTLLQELNKCKTELQYWRFKAPTIPLACTSCGRLFPPPAPNEDLANQPLPWLEIGGEDIAGDDLAGDELPNLMPLVGAGNEDWNLYWDQTVKKVDESASLKVGPSLSASELLEESSKPGGSKAGLPKEAKPDSPKEHKGKEGKVATSMPKRKLDDTSKDNQDANAKKPKRILKTRKK